MRGREKQGVEACKREIFSPLACLAAWRENKCSSGQSIIAGIKYAPPLAAWEFNGEFYWTFTGRSVYIAFVFKRICLFFNEIARAFARGVNMRIYPLTRW